MTVMLDSIEKVKTFVAKASLFPCDIDLVSGRYTIDGKSIIGIFSLDLSKPIKVVLLDESLTAQAEQQFAEFLA